MQIDFTRSRPEGSRLIAHVADKGKLPDGLERHLAEGAQAARFEGKAGQAFDGFVERDGTVVRVAVAGAGDPSSDRRAAHLGQRIADLQRMGGELVVKAGFIRHGWRAQPARDGWQKPCPSASA